jgi:hypothetical protein
MTTPKPKQTQCYQITLNTTNYLAGTNKYRLNFPSPIDFSNNNARLSMYQYSVYNSTYNISSSLGNNTYSIVWVNGTTYNFTIPNGYYDFNGLNQIFQYNMAQNYLYLQSTSNSSQVMYFIDCLPNITAYAAEIDILYVPTTLPSGYQIPSGASWSLPATATYPQLVLSPNLQTIFGFPNQNTFPVSTTASPAINLSFLSTTYPVLSPVFCYCVATNLINSPFNVVPGMFFQIPLTAGFGELIEATLPNSIAMTIAPGRYQYIEFQLYDQNMNPLILIDPEITISVLIMFDA